MPHELLIEPDLPVKLALDESLVELDPAALERALASPLLAAIILKPTLLGGFARCLELAAPHTRTASRRSSRHALEGPIGTAACHELARAIGADVPVGLGRHPPRELRSARRAHPGDVRLGSRARPPSRILGSSRRRPESSRAAASPWSPRSSSRHGRRDDPRGLCRARCRASRSPCSTPLVRRRARAPARGRRALAARRRRRDRAVHSGSTGDPRGVVLSRAASTPPPTRARSCSVAAMTIAGCSPAARARRRARRRVRCMPRACRSCSSTTTRRRARRSRRAALHARLARTDAARHAARRSRRGVRPRACAPCCSAAPPRPLALVAAALERGVPVRLTYGLTETFGQSRRRTIARRAARAARRRDDRRRHRRAPALLRVRGPMLATCYLDGTPIAPELATADLGFVEAGGAPRGRPRRRRDHHRRRERPSGPGRGGARGDAGRARRVRVRRRRSALGPDRRRAVIADGPAFDSRPPPRAGTRSSRRTRGRAGSRSSTRCRSCRRQDRSTQHAPRCRRADRLRVTWYTRVVGARFLDDEARAAFKRAIETIESASAVEVVIAVRRRSAGYFHANLVDRCASSRSRGSRRCCSPSSAFGLVVDPGRSVRRRRPRRRRRSSCCPASSAC